MAKVLDGNNRGFSAGVIEALEWLASEGVDVINMSLGTTCERHFASLQQAVGCFDRSRTVLVAAGSDKMMFPAAIPSVIAVVDNDLYGYMSDTDRKRFRLDYAVAPHATYALQDSHGGQSRDIPFTASMAAPYVAGVVALAKQGHPDMTLAQIRRLLSCMSEGGVLLDFRRNPLLRRLLVEKSLPASRPQSESAADDHL